MSAAGVAHSAAFTPSPRHQQRERRWNKGSDYLTVFAVATFSMCIGFGLMGGRWAAIVLTPIWVLLVVALSIWAARQRLAVTGMGRIHAWVIGSWTVAWGVTVFVGSFVYPDTLPWWVLGGVLTAIPPVIGALFTARRTGR